MLHRLLSWLGRHRPRRLAVRYSHFIGRWRWAFVVAWIAIAGAGFVLLPGLGQSGAGSADLGGLVSVDSPPIQAQINSLNRFNFPLLSRLAIVQRDPDGLDPYAQARAVLRAVALDQRTNVDPRELLGALPVTNTAGLFPSSSEEGTTAITYMFTSPSAGFAEQTRQARDFAREQIDRPDDHLIGVTGTIPARVQQGNLIGAALPKVVLATLLAIVLIVGVTFRSVLAPVVTLFSAGVAYLTTTHAVAYFAAQAGVVVPSDLEPLLVALQLGIITDYAIFYLSGVRGRLIEGDQPRRAAVHSTAQFTPIVLAAGATVASGVAVLAVARSPLFRAFGPGMALAVLVSLIVAVTLIPALLAIFGRATFWPGTPPRRSTADDGQDISPAVPGDRVVRRLTQRRWAALVAVLATAGLLVAALPLQHLHLGLSIVQSLPADTTERVASAAATEGFAPGILSPTVLLLEAPDITDQREELDRLQTAIAGQPGVAGVVGPKQQPAPFPLGVVLSDSGDAARLLVIFDEQPLGAAAVDDLRELRQRMPDLLAQAGLPQVQIEVAGDTALAELLVDQTRADLGRLALTVMLVDLALLVIFLRALIAPLYLLATSLLGVAATLGLTTLIFQDVIGADGLTFYVPIAAAVLLVALGSDYNIFGVGRVWEEGARRPLREAMILAIPRSSRAIVAAGITLATSFGLLVLVPLQPFRELALALAMGVLIDVLIVRSLLMPCLLSLVGPFSSWPSRRLRAARPES